MVLLRGEQHLTAPTIAARTPHDDETVCRGLLRYQVEGAAGLADAPQAGAPPKIISRYREQLLAVVRWRPGSLGLPF